MKFIFIAIGLGLWMWVHKRRFERTNSFGVQEFHNFWHLLGSNGFELILVLFGLFMISLGLVLFFA
jgi:hypothetical protein